MLTLHSHQLSGKMKRLTLVSLVLLPVTSFSSDSRLTSLGLSVYHLTVRLIADRPLPGKVHSERSVDSCLAAHADLINLIRIANKELNVLDMDIHWDPFFNPEDTNDIRQRIKDLPLASLYSLRDHYASFRRTSETTGAVRFKRICSRFFCGLSPCSSDSGLAYTAPPNNKDGFEPPSEEIQKILDFWFKKDIQKQTDEASGSLLPTTSL